MKRILFLTTNFPPNHSVGTHRVSKILKFIDHRKFNFWVLTLPEDDYDLELGEKAGDAAKIPSAVQVQRTPKRDLTLIFTNLKRVLKSVLQKQKPEAGVYTSAVKVKSSASPMRRKSALHRLAESTRKMLFSVFEFPDKYIGWYRNAVRVGTRLIREKNIEIILTTAPPHSMFLIARRLKKRTGARLVLDYRDPWSLSRWDSANGFSLMKKLEQYLEKKVIQEADRILFVTPKLRDEYANFYSDQPADKFLLLSNGYDPDDFPRTIQSEPKKDGIIRMVHLGTLYKKRNPLNLFLAIKNLKDSGQLGSFKLIIEFYGFIANELNILKEKIVELGIDDLVSFKGSISFEESIQTMFQADILLLIQPGTDLQIPAKLYEYMYTRKPIFAMALPDSATDRAISEGRLGVVADSSSVADIEQKLIPLLTSVDSGFEPDQEYINRFNMKEQIYILENLLEQL